MGVDFMRIRGALLAAAATLAGLPADARAQDAAPAGAEDPYVYEVERSFRDYYGPIPTARFFRKGQGIITGGKDRMLRGWDASGKLLWEARGHQNWIWQIALRPDEKFLASIGIDGLLLIWDVDTQKPVQRIALTQNLDNTPLSVAYHPTLQRVAVGMTDGNAVEYDADSGKEIARYPAAGAVVNAVAYSPDGRLLATSAHDSVKLWDIQKRELAMTCGKHEHAVVYSLAFSRDGRRLASGGSDNFVMVWDVAGKGELAGVFEGHDEIVISLAFDADGRHVVSGDSAGVAHVWSTEKYETVAKLEGHRFSIHSVDFSPDGRRVLTTGLDGTFRVWTSPEGRQVLSKKGHGGFIYALDYTTDGRAIAAAGLEYSVKMWDAQTAALSLELEPQAWSDIVNWMAISPHRKGELAVGHKNGTIKTWNIATREIDFDILAHSGHVWALDFVPGGKYLLSGGEDGVVHVWNLHSKELAYTERHESTVRSLSAHPRDPVYAACDNAGLVVIRKVDEKKKRDEPLVIEAHTTAAMCVKYSPDGKMVASAGEDGLIKLWDPKKGTLIRALKGHTESVRTLSFHPDGQYLASASQDRTVRIWRVADGACTQVLEGYLDEVSCVAFHPGGEALATGAWDGEVRIWARKKKADRKGGK